MNHRPPSRTGAAAFMMNHISMFVMEEWDIPPAKDPAEKDFDRAKEISESMPPMDRHLLLKGEEERMELRRAYERKMRSLIGFIMICSVMAACLIAFGICKYLTLGAPRSSKLDNTFLEGYEVIINIIGLTFLLAAKCFGITMIYFIFRFIMSHFKSALALKRNGR
jgi:hypothetical protein